MKKFLIALMAVLSAGVMANAAAPCELTVGYGGYTQMDATDMHDGGGKVNTAWGAVTAGLNFKVLPKLWIGPSYTFSSSSYKHHDTDLYYHVIMLNMRYQYYRTSIFNMYAHVGLGADITHRTNDYDSDNKGYFAFQISPICAKVDLSRSISMFGELGFGAQGLLQVGFNFKL